MKTEQSKLEDLLVDEEELHEDLLSEVVGEYAQIGNQSGRFIPKPAFQELSSRQKVLLVLLCQKARKELGKSESEWMAPSDIHEAGGIKLNTIYPRVRELEEIHLLESNDGEYRIPIANYENVKEILLEGGEND